MSISPTEPIPDGMHSVTPYLICEGAADAIEFYKKAFGATELSRLPDPNGKVMHASIRIGDSTVMLVDDAPSWGMLGPKALKGSAVYIHLYVNDVDALTARAAFRRITGSERTAAPNSSRQHSMARFDRCGIACVSWGMAHCG
jgi:PhnB protein